MPRIGKRRKPPAGNERCILFGNAVAGGATVEQSRAGERDDEQPSARKQQDEADGSSESGGMLANLSRGCLPLFGRGVTRRVNGMTSAIRDGRDKSRPYTCHAVAHERRNALTRGAEHHREVAP